MSNYSKRRGRARATDGDQNQDQVDDDQTQDQTDDAEETDDAPMTSYSPATLGPVVPQRVMALIDGGFVVALGFAQPDGTHPFGDDADDKRVLDVSGVPCQLGYVADSRGNVAPAPHDGRPLLGHEPAYHDRSNPPALHTAAVRDQFSTSEPSLNAGASRGTPGADHDPADHPQAGLVQESPVKSEDDPA